MNRKFLLRLLFSIGLFVAVSTTPGADQPRKLLIVGQGPDGHAATTHEYTAGAHVLATLLKGQKDLAATVVVGDEPWSEGPKLLDATDGVVLLVTQGSAFMQTNAARYAAFQRLAARGGAITALHWSVGAKDAQYIPGQLELLGATRGGPQRKYVESLGEYQRVDPKHPILTAIENFTAFDEHYYRLDRRPDIQPLLIVHLENKDEMVAWAFERPDHGRSFGFVGLHFHANWQYPVYRRFVVQGVRWTLQLPIPAEGNKVEIDPKALELNGKLPPLPREKKAEPKR